VIRAVFLDAGPLGLLTQRAGKSPEVDECKRWLVAVARAGVEVAVPEISDYEVRRELVRAGKTHGIARLDVLAARARYVPITTEAMQLAATLWANARNAGAPTAAPAALDADVILAAQALTAGVAVEDIVVATTNVGHLVRFINARIWREITA
jgi:predicted nucleic acid-binding protein